MLRHILSRAISGCSLPCLPAMPRSSGRHRAWPCAASCCAVDEAIGRALAQVARGQEIDVKVHPDLVEDIEARIAERQSRDRRRLALVVSGDASLAPGDAVLRWDRGGVIVDAQSRRQAVLDELAPIMDHSPE